MKKTLMVLSLLCSTALYGKLQVLYSYDIDDVNIASVSGDVTLDEGNKGVFISQAFGHTGTFKVDKLKDGKFCIESHIKKDGKIIAEPVMVVELGKTACASIGERNNVTDEGAKVFELRIMLIDTENKDFKEHIKSWDPGTEISFEN